MLWYLVFNDSFFPSGFWLKLSLGALLLLIVVILTRRSEVNLKPSVSGGLIGVGSGLLLYLLFWTGYHVMSTVPGFVGTISSVYAFAGGTPLAAIAVLLLYPIGPAEEFYWRGFIQRRLGGGRSQVTAVVITSVLYASIHLVTLNPSLLLVALIGGLVWGGVYAWTRSLFPALVSHILFDELIFVFLAIH
jgi:membrane protease YdiL (CAAX protease family)